VTHLGCEEEFEESSGFHKVALNCQGWQWVPNVACHVLPRGNAGSDSTTASCPDFCLSRGSYSKRGSCSFPLTELSSWQHQDGKRLLLLQASNATMQWIFRFAPSPEKSTEFHRMRCINNINVAVLIPWDHFCSCLIDSHLFCEHKTSSFVKPHSCSNLQRKGWCHLFLSLLFKTHTDDSQSHWASNWVSDKQSASEWWNAAASDAPADFSVCACGNIYKCSSSFLILTYTFQ